MSAIGRPATPAAPIGGLRRFAAPFACVVITSFAAWFYATVPAGNVDVGWLLVVGERVLDGARLHIDIVEINPPFSVWLYLPFLFTERLTGLRAELWLACGLPAFALLSVWLFARILHQGGLGVRPWLMPAMLVVLLWLFPRDFGQREQFAVIALLPWLALLAARDRSPDFSAGTLAHCILAGLGAAVFIAIKPPLAVFALALPALYLCIQRRSIRPLMTTENAIGAALVIIYLGWLAAFHRQFFMEILPSVRELYLPMRMSITAMLGLWPVMVLAAIVVTVFIAAWPGRVDRVALILLLAGAGYLPAFVLMGKGWSYQAFPSLTLVILALLVHLARPRADTPLPLLSWAGAVAGLVLIAQLFGSELLALRGGQDVVSPAAAIETVVKRPTVASIATRLQPAFPLTRLVSGRYVSRNPAFWWADNAAGLIPSADAGRREELTSLRDRLIEQSVEEIEAVRPDIVIDGGSVPTPGQRTVQDHPPVERLLQSYRVLYRDPEVTVWLRSDIAQSSGAAPAR